MLYDIIVQYPLQSFAFLIFSAVFWLHQLNKVNHNNPKGLPLPPGPRRWPIIGSVLSWPYKHQHIVLNDMFSKYGDMVYFEMFGKPFLILGKQEMALELFEKRSKNFSDRMRAVMMLDLMGWSYNILLMPYGSWWRKHRRAFHQHFNPEAVLKYQPIQTRETRALLRRLLAAPDKFRDHVRHAFGALVMDVTYGIHIKESEDPYIAASEIAMEGATIAAIPGQFLVDLIPMLKHVPDWFPGAGFKRWAARYHKINETVRKAPLEFVEGEIEKGGAPPSVARSMLERVAGKGLSVENAAEEREVIENTTAIAYVAGSDTTVSAILIFFLAMVTSPEAQKKAKEELDRVVGSDRLPDFSDRDSLPYINAIAKEVLRWQTIAPLGFPHMATEADEYQGYYIPKGTVLMGLAWSFMHDPVLFPDPFTFKPERYLKDGELDPTVVNPETATFGYGRRICPGRHLVDHSLFLTIASVLHTFDIVPALDDAGKPIEVVPEMTDGVLAFPLEFQCNIKPRSGKAETLVRGSAEAV